MATMLERETSTLSKAAPVRARWLGRIAYREAWDLQRRLAAARAEGAIGDQLLLLEHPPVLTLGRHADERHVLAGPALLAERGIEVIRVERGGEVTYHGPGQLVAYPILRLADRGLLLRPLVRALEGAMADACAAFGVAAGRREGHPGCWCDPDGLAPRKIGALGIRVERGVTYHGIALNVTTDLADFDLIDPCGMPGVTATSIAREAGWPVQPPSTASVADAAVVFARALATRLEAPLEGDLDFGDWLDGADHSQWSRSESASTPGPPRPTDSGDRARSEDPWTTTDSGDEREPDRGGT